MWHLLLKIPAHVGQEDPRPCRAVSVYYVWEWETAVILFQMRHVRVHETAQSKIRERILCDLMIHFMHREGLPDQDPRPCRAEDPRPCRAVSVYHEKSVWETAVHIKTSLLLLFCHFVSDDSCSCSWNSAIKDKMQCNGLPDQRFEADIRKLVMIAIVWERTW